MKVYVTCSACKGKKPDFSTMKNTNLLTAHGFYMVYGCNHLTITDEKDWKK